MLINTRLIVHKFKNHQAFKLCACTLRTATNPSPSPTSVFGFSLQSSLPSFWECSFSYPPPPFPSRRSLSISTPFIFLRPFPSELPPSLVLNTSLSPLAPLNHYVALMCSAPTLSNALQRLVTLSGILSRPPSAWYFSFWSLRANAPHAQPLACLCHLFTWINFPFFFDPECLFFRVLPTNLPFPRTSPLQSAATSSFWQAPPCPLRLPSDCLCISSAHIPRFMMSNVFPSVLNSCALFDPLHPRPGGPNFSTFSYVWKSSICICRSGIASNQLYSPFA